MKKLVCIIYLLLIFPMNIFAYSEYIIPGGESIGIEIKSDGILVVGFYRVNGKFNKGTPSIKVGDKILEVEGKTVNTIEELVSAMEEGKLGRELSLTIERDNKKKNIKLGLIKDGEKYKTGLYVKDEITGIGTLTYIDPSTGIFGALGHNVVETNTNSTVEVKTGSIFRSSITSIDRSVSGTPGGKNAKFYSNSIYGNIDKNLPSGIYGLYTSEVPSRNTLKVAELDEIELGKASIYTVLDGEKREEFKIEITKVDSSSKMKHIYFKVTDERLLEKTGGIVQGMSGSPIIQNDKIVGAITHVVISNPESGYGISIVKMLENGEENR